MQYIPRTPLDLLPRMIRTYRAAMRCLQTDELSTVSSQLAELVTLTSRKGNTPRDARLEGGQGNANNSNGRKEVTAANALDRESDTKSD